MNKKVRVGLLLCGIVTSSLVMADCPNTMTVQLLEDCIVVEGSGSSFPNSTYANMDQYQDWLKTQEHQDVLVKSKTKVTPINRYVVIPAKAEITNKSDITK